MPTIKFESAEIYYQEYGKGDPLLLIAGLGSDSTSWLPIIVPLSNHYKLIVFDNRGVGRSTQDNSGITIDDMCEDVIQVIDHLALAPVNVLSHSMGGMIAMRLAARRPELVRNLILTATTPNITERNKLLLTDMSDYLENGLNKKQWFRNLFYWIFSPSFFEDKDMVEQAVNMAINYRYPQSNDSFKNQVEAIIGYDGKKDVGGINSRTLLIGGDEDLLFPAHQSENLLMKINGLESVIVKGAAHSVHMDKPDEFIKLVTDFLNKSR